MRSPGQAYLDTFQKEHERTRKVLRAFPLDQAEFRPHPRSVSARELAFTFVMEQLLIRKALLDELKLGGGMPEVPKDLASILDRFEQDYEELVRLMAESPPERFEGTVKFPVGPGQLRDWPKMEFLWFLLHDQIHHRGQYTIYVRMAGGKVPAVYGPSGDEPWR